MARLFGATLRNFRSLVSRAHRGPTSTNSEIRIGATKVSLCLLKFGLITVQCHRYGYIHPCTGYGSLSHAIDCLIISLTSTVTAPFSLFCTCVYLSIIKGPPSSLGGPSQPSQGSSWGVPPPNRAPGSGQWAEANGTQNNRNTGKMSTLALLHLYLHDYNFVSSYLLMLIKQNIFCYCFVNSVMEHICFTIIIIIIITCNFVSINATTHLIFQFHGSRFHKNSCPVSAMIL